MVTFSMGDESEWWKEECRYWGADNAAQEAARNEKEQLDQYYEQMKQSIIENSHYAEALLENGRSYPKLNSFMLICKALDCNADYFFSGVISDSLPEQIGEMLSSLSVEEQRMVWRLVDCYIHQKDDSTI